MENLSRIHSDEIINPIGFLVRKFFLPQELSSKNQPPLVRLLMARVGVSG